MDRLRVGGFELCASQRTLSAAGQPLELGARAFDLLRVLAEQPGRLVSKATLLERVWPKLVVDENNLPAQIASLRRVLGADAIRTVQGYGYRLDLPVAALPETPVCAGAAVPAPARRTGTLVIPRRSWADRLGPLIGRDVELRELEQALQRCSLVSVVGTAGVGKTRLGREIVARAQAAPAQPVAWVALGPLTDAGHVPSAIARVLGLALPENTGGFDALARALEQEPLLLVLDCVEHLATALATPLAGLIAQTSELRVLLTSQVPLGVAGETVYRLAALPLPARDTPADAAGHYAAIALFAQRAAAADQRFALTAANTPLVSEICRRLDGIPLALELAAARVPALGLDELLARLDDRFRLLKLTGAGEARHSALHTALDWSYALLTPQEQQVFDRLGAFAGSFALPVAARCAGDAGRDDAAAIDLIARLVDRSLVMALPVDPPRYVLTETARHYALERLAASGRLHEARGRMARAMGELLDAAFEAYWSLDEALWLHRYEPEIDNTRAAMDWAQLHDAALSVALYGSSWPLFVEHDLAAEGRVRYGQVLSQLSDSLPRARLGRFWNAIATFDSTRQCDRARYAAELAATMHATNSDVRAHYYALMLLAFNWREDSPQARAAYQAARRLENPGWPARLLTHGALTAGALHTCAGDYPAAREAYLRAMHHALTLSEREALAASVHVVELDIARDDIAAALQLGRPLAQSLRHLGRRETRFEVLVLNFSALLIAGEADEARVTGAELLDHAQRFDSSRLYAVLDAMAWLACLSGHAVAAADIELCADAAHATHGAGRRGPVQERVRGLVLAALETGLGSAWRAARETVRARQGAGERLDELSACALALGLDH
ncbi:MAG TPA: winged helix-turn-helix domain-containing protein [Steroidobacteraceae bacterium]|nr:winged helix-turn-helix domain-containing protein [Steroidobacteraceae bacterium]